MTRRNAQLPWGNRSNSSIYGGGGAGRGGIGRGAMLAGIVLATLVVGYFLFTRACSSTECDKFYCATGDSFATPEGYERVTKIYAFNAEKGGVPAGSNIQVQLKLENATTDGRNLGFYRYVQESKTWEPVTPAVLDAQGQQVSATLTSAPERLTVMRRLSPAGHVVAYLPANGRLHADATGKITILHTRDFKPNSDGGLTGEPSAVKPDGSYAWYPTVWVDGSETGLIPLVSGILQNTTTRSTHVQQILKKAQDLQLAGIDIAYMDLRVAERTSFTLFVAELASGLHAQGKKLTLTLPAPLRLPDRIDEGAYDWAELGKSADVLQIWPYRDQSTYRRDMPEILTALTAEVEPTKLVMTVSPYAVEKSNDGIATMSVVQAMITATKLSVRAGNDNRLTTNTNVSVVATNLDREENRSGIAWSPDTASVYFTYQQNGGRTVWIENVFSIGFKLELIPRFKLGGVAIEDASDSALLGNIWPALIPFINSGQPVLMQPNPTDLTPTWEVSKGSMEGGSRGVLTWITPAEPGTYTVSITVSDGVARFRNDIPLTVQPKASPTAVATPTAAR